MRSTGSLLVSVIITLVCGCLFLVAVDATRALAQTLDAGNIDSYELKPGTSLAGMARDLHELGLVEYARDARYISLFGRLTGKANQIQAGEYAVTPDMRVLGLLQAMFNGEVRQYSLTIVEGWSLRQLLQAISAHTAIVKSDPPLTDDHLKKLLSIEDASAEGWFFPDTYSFPKGTPAIDILRRAHGAMRVVLKEEWAQRDTAQELPYISAYQALIMASIIEKETAVGSERGQIAGVFVRRLLKGMRLQTDPTVIYGIGEKFDGNIRRADLRRATPYNTYTQYGLPPTPIAMPGRDSIHAALHPEPGNSLYFVARGDGSHEFSDTLEEHNAAVRKFQLQR